MCTHTYSQLPHAMKGKKGRETAEKRLQCFIFGCNLLVQLKVAEENGIEMATMERERERESEREKKEHKNFAIGRNKMVRLCGTKCSNHNENNEFRH